MDTRRGRSRGGVHILPFYDKDVITLNHIKSTNWWELRLAGLVSTYNWSLYCGHETNLQQDRATAGADVITALGASYAQEQLMTAV